MTGFSKRAALRILVGTTLAALAVHSARADGSGRPGTVPTGSQWTVTVTPYAWAPFIQGDATVRERTANIYVNPVELIDHLERMPWMSYIEARRGPLAFYNDIVYANAGIGVDGVRRFGSATIDANLGADFQQTIVEVGAAYQIAKWHSGGSGSLKDGYSFDRYTAIDLIAGARYWQQDLSINLALTGTLDTTGLVIVGNRAIARSGQIDGRFPPSTCESNSVGFGDQVLIPKRTQAAAVKSPRSHPSIALSASSYGPRTRSMRSVSQYSTSSAILSPRNLNTMQYSLL